MSTLFMTRHIHSPRVKSRMFKLWVSNSLVKVLHIAMILEEKLPSKFFILCFWLFHHHLPKNNAKKFIADKTHINSPNCLRHRFSIKKYTVSRNWCEIPSRGKRVEQHQRYFRILSNEEPKNAIWWKENRDFSGVEDRKINISTQPLVEFRGYVTRLKWKPRRVVSSISTHYTFKTYYPCIIHALCT